MKWVLILIQLFALSLLFPSKALASSVVLNEFMPQPDDETEWVELYNPTDQAVDLNGWLIKDGNSITYDDISLNGQIASKGFKVFEHTKGWLNDTDSEMITLLNGSATIDSYSYSGATPGKTFGRQPDAGAWTESLTPTKGIPNESVIIITPIPSPSPTLSPTPSPSPSPSPTPKSSLTISNVPSSIKVDQEFSVNISIVNFQPNSTYYLKGAFKLTGGANYFGLTKVGSYWVKNKEHYKDQDHITTDPSGNWNGNLNVQGDPSDAGFIGAGNYTFKVGYYFDSSSVSWSNEVNIFLDSPGGTTATSVPQPKPSPSPKRGNLTNTQAFITEPPTGPTLKPTLTPIILGTISASALPPTPSTETPRVQVAGSTLANIFMIGGGLIIILIAVLTFTFLKNGHFYNPFTNRNF